MNKRNADVCYKIIYILNSMIATLLFGKTVFLLLENQELLFDSKALILAITAICVVSVKAIRLYIILYGKNVAFLEHLKQYCRVMPVTILFHYKLGEFFRMFGYGHFLGNYGSGVVCVLVDRFIDTMALVTIMVGCVVFANLDFSWFLYLLLLFLCVTGFFYLIFPQLYQFWKKTFIKANASKRRMKLLKLLEDGHNAYVEIAAGMRGKFVVIYILSVLVWGIELGGVFVYSQVTGAVKEKISMPQYLLSALTGADFEFMNLFSIYSVAYLFALSVIFYVGRQIRQYRRRR